MTGVWLEEFHTQILPSLIPYAYDDDTENKGFSAICLLHMGRAEMSKKQVLLLSLVVALPAIGLLIALVFGALEDGANMFSGMMTVIVAVAGLLVLVLSASPILILAFYPAAGFASFAPPPEEGGGPGPAQRPRPQADADDDAFEDDDDFEDDGGFEDDGFDDGGFDDGGFGDDGGEELYDDDGDFEDFDDFDDDEDWG